MIETVQINKLDRDNTCPRRLRENYGQQICNKNTDDMSYITKKTYR